jgi:dihydrofolate reductase/thymidylate synthase
MSLAPFSIIVAIDSGNGIAKNGEIPWNSKEDMKFFRDTTIGRRKNAVIMGRLTYESIPEDLRPLDGRKCIIISRSWKQEHHPEISVYPSLSDALAGLGGSINAYEDVYIAGGEQLYAEAIRDFMYLCKKIHVTRFKSDYGCNQFFPFDAVKELPNGLEPIKTREYTRYTFAPKVGHDEYQYLNILERIRDEGEPKPDRTGVGVKEIFGERMIFDLRDRLPILTTKRIFYDVIIKELLFFISGKTNTQILEDQKVNIWKKNTAKKTLEELGLPYDEGDMGPGYGFQWRHWGAEYSAPYKNEDDQTVPGWCYADYRGKGIDQLQELIENIRKDPHSRRHILSAWNVVQIKDMALPPCHCFVQFNVSSDRKFLDCQLYQRSGDMFLGVPFNITSYALLTAMIAHVTGLRPRKLVHILGSTHIYNNHNDQVKRQIGRTPRPFPRLSFREATRLHEIDDFTANSFIIEGYNSWPAIQADMAV